MSRFEDRLFSEIVEQHGALLTDEPAHALPARAPAPGRAWIADWRPARRPATLAAAALALTVVLLALVIGFGSGGPGGAPAYAVVSNPDGTVTVAVSELAGVAGASETLHTLGVAARVVRSESACRVMPGEYRTATLTPEQSAQIASGSAAGGESSVVLRPSAIPAGDTVVIGVRRLPAQGAVSAVGLEIAIYEGATPSCLPAETG